MVSIDKVVVVESPHTPMYSVVFEDEVVVTVMESMKEDVSFEVWRDEVKVTSSNLASRGDLYGFTVDSIEYSDKGEVVGENRLRAIEEWSR